MWELEKKMVGFLFPGKIEMWNFTIFFAFLRMIAKEISTCRETAQRQHSLAWGVNPDVYFYSLRHASKLPVESFPSSSFLLSDLSGHMGGNGDNVC